MDALSVLLTSDRPSQYFRQLQNSGDLNARLPELAACVGVPQNPIYHPEGDVFEHTLLVIDCAAELRDQAVNPLGLMLSALTHDLGKALATEVHPDGRITAYGHEQLGIEPCRQLVSRLTDDQTLIDYAVNMTWLHMRPNMLAEAKSRRKKTRQLFDLSVCPEDLILLSRADASGKLDKPYDPGLEAFLRERLKDYRNILTRPMVTEADLLTAGVAPGPDLEACLVRARQLHLSGQERPRALRQVLQEYYKAER